MVDVENVPILRRKEILGFAQNPIVCGIGGTNVPANESSYASYMIEQVYRQACQVAVVLAITCRGMRIVKDMTTGASDEEICPPVMKQYVRYA